MIKLVMKYLLHGIAWGCMCMTAVYIVIDLFSPGGLHFDNVSFTTNAMGSILVGVAAGTTPIVYEFDRLRAWQQVLIHAVVCQGVFIPVAFWLEWLPAWSGTAIVMSVVWSVVFFWVIWLGFYLYHRHEANKINRKLKERE